MQASWTKVGSEHEKKRELLHVSSKTFAMGQHRVRCQCQVVPGYEKAKDPKTGEWQCSAHELCNVDLV